MAYREGRGPREHERPRRIEPKAHGAGLSDEVPTNPGSTAVTVFVTPSLLAGPDVATQWVDCISEVDEAVEIIEAGRRLPWTTVQGTVLPGPEVAQVRTISDARKVLEALGVSEEQIQRNIRYALGLCDPQEVVP